MYTNQQHSINYLQLASELSIASFIWEKNTIWIHWGLGFILIQHRIETENCNELLISSIPSRKCLIKIEYMFLLHSAISVASTLHIKLYFTITHSNVQYSYFQSARFNFYNFEKNHIFYAQFRIIAYFNLIFSLKSE